MWKGVEMKMERERDRESKRMEEEGRLRIENGTEVVGGLQAASLRRGKRFGMAWRTWLGRASIRGRERKLHELVDTHARDGHEIGITHARASSSLD